MAVNKRLIGAGAAGGAFVNDQNFRDQQILKVKEYLPEIQNKINPYDICEKRITEIISTTT